MHRTRESDLQKKKSQCSFIMKSSTRLKLDGNWCSPKNKKKALEKQSLLNNQQHSSQFMKNSLLGPLLARIVIISKQIMVVGLTGLGPYGPGRARALEISVTGRKSPARICHGPARPGPCPPLLKCIKTQNRKLQNKNSDSPKSHVVKTQTIKTKYEITKYKT